MVEHDRQIRELLYKLKVLEVEEITSVRCSTDNRTEAFTMPDGGTTMLIDENNTQWQSGYRVPCATKCPGVIKAGSMANDIAAHEGMLPTLLAAAVHVSVKNELLKGRKVGPEATRFTWMDTNVYRHDRARRRGHARI